MVTLVCIFSSLSWGLLHSRMVVQDGYFHMAFLQIMPLFHDRSGPTLTSAPFLWLIHKPGNLYANPFTWGCMPQNIKYMHLNTWLTEDPMEEHVRKSTNYLGTLLLLSPVVQQPEVHYDSSTNIGLHSHFSEHSVSAGLFC